MTTNDLVLKYTSELTIVASKWINTYDVTDLGSQDK